MELSSIGIDFSELLPIKSDESDSIDSETLNRSQCANVKENLKDVGEEKVTELEEMSKNSSDESVFKTYFRSGANYYVMICLLALFIFSQILASASDYWVAFW